MEKGQEAHLGQPVSGFELALVLCSPTPKASHTDYFCPPNSCPMCAENYLYSLGLPLSLVFFTIQIGYLQSVRDQSSCEWGALSFPYKSARGSEKNETLIAEELYISMDLFILICEVFSLSNIIAHSSHG